MIDAFDYQTITSVWLQYDGHVKLPSPMVGLAGCVSQWVFDREAICQQAGLIGVVISASGEYRELPHDALSQRVQTELAQHFGPLPPLKWQRVITEKRATFSATPGLKRPPQQTSLKNFWLAGDYTAGDYPATLERALQEINWAERSKLQGKLIDGKYHGLGVVCFIEGGAAGPKETARLEVNDDGTINVFLIPSPSSTAIQSFIPDFEAKTCIAVNFSETPSRPGAGVLAGQHTRPILRELGYTNVEIEELYARRVVASEPV